MVTPNTGEAYVSTSPGTGMASEASTSYDGLALQPYRNKYGYLYYLSPSLSLQTFNPGDKVFVWLKYASPSQHMHQLGIFLLRQMPWSELDVDTGST